MSTRPSVKTAPEVSREADSPATLADCTESTKRDFVSVLSRALIQNGLDEQILLALYQTKADGVAVALRQGENAVCRASLGAAPDVGVVVEPGEGICGQCIATGKSILVNDLPGDVKSLIAVPIFAESKVEGLVAVFAFHQDAFDQSHLIQLAEISRDISGRLSPHEPIELVQNDDQPLPISLAEDTVAGPEKLDSVNDPQPVEITDENWKSKRLAILDEVTARQLGPSLPPAEVAMEEEAPPKDFSIQTGGELDEPSAWLEQERPTKRILKWDVVALVVAVLVAVVMFGIWLHHRNNKPYVSTGLQYSRAVEVFRVARVPSPANLPIAE